MTSAECLSSEELIKKQSIHNYKDCKGPYDMITSVAIPLPYCEFVYLSKCNLLFSYEGSITSLMVLKERMRIATCTGGSYQVTLAQCFGLIWSISNHFGLLCSISIHLDLFGQLRSISSNSVHYGPFRSISIHLAPLGPHWSISDHFGLLRSIPIHLALFSRLQSIPSNSVHQDQIRSIWSISFHLAPFGPLLSIQSILDHFGLLCSISIHLALFRLLRSISSNSVHYSPFRSSVHLINFDPLSSIRSTLVYLVHFGLIDIKLIIFVCCIFSFFFFFNFWMKSM